MAMTDPRCHLLGGLFAIFIQVSLALVAVATLIVKRQYEHPRRDWYVWFLDIGKQGIGSAVGHFANIYLSQFIAYQVPDADECQWYCFTYIVDCTVGLGMNIAFLRIFEKCLLNCKDPEHNIVIFGDYGDPPNIMKWLLQLGIWLTIVVSVKIIILSLLIHILLPINTIIAYIFVVFVPWPEVELILVMILIPAGMNVLQFWITDTFLQRHDLAHKPTLVLDLDEELLDEDSEKSGRSSPSLHSQRLRADPFPNAGRFSLPTHSECLLLLFRYSGLQFLWSTLFGVPPAVRKRKEKSEKGQKKMEMGLLRPSSSREQVQVAGAAEVIRDEF